MKKDVIYIDTEDDITGVIQRVKLARGKIIALVPPKGSTVLQSAVNLKLLKRAADSTSKRLVIVTSNQALTALAGSLELYVARNLQTKPSIPSKSSVKDMDEEPTDVGDKVELQTSAAGVPLNEGGTEVEITSDELEDIDAENEIIDENKNKPKSVKKRPNNQQKVPNFDSFRKKLLIGGALAVLLAVGLFLLFGRSKAGIVIRAETTPVDVAFDATISTDLGSSDPKNYALKAVIQERKETLSQTFTPTGEKDVGEKSTGRVRFESDSFTALSAGIDIPAGSKVASASGKQFITSEAVRLTISNSGKQTVGVVAEESGPSYNGASGSAYGGPNTVVAKFVGSTSGGTSKVVKVVSESDIESALEELKSHDTSAAREELTKAFSKNVIVFDDSFESAIGSPQSSPAAGEQASEGHISVDVTYSMLGAMKDDLGSAIDSFIVSEMSNRKQQRVYQNNLSDAKIEKVSQDGSSAVYKVATLAYYGPQFNIDALKSEVAGKKFGEARAYLQDLPGVKSVDINLSPFWSRQMPGKDKVKIELDVDDAVSSS